MLFDVYSYAFKRIQYELNGGDKSIIFMTV